MQKTWNGITYIERKCVRQCTGIHTWEVLNPNNMVDVEPQSFRRGRVIFLCDGGA